MTDETDPNEQDGATLEEVTPWLGECFTLEAGTVRKGYPRVDVGDRSHGQGQARYLGAHRVAWMAVNGPIPDGGQVLHHCDNRACIRASHLYVGTNDDNVRDRVMRLRSFRKLSDEEVTLVRSLYGPRGAGGLSGRELATRFGVSRSHISRIVHGFRGAGAG